MTTKKYLLAPLPFQGQKRFFYKDFSEILRKLPENCTIVDLFGGSGLLSHWAKKTLPNARVIYNDYDYYTRRLQAIPATNKRLEILRGITSNIPQEARVDGEFKEKILRYLDKWHEEEERGDFVDWQTLGASLLFSGRYITTYEDLRKYTYYNVVKRESYPLSSDYLEGIEVTHLDYLELLRNFEGEANVIFIADPPYLSTSLVTYKSGHYWRLSDYLYILTSLRGKNFVYFTSGRSEILELSDYIAKIAPEASPLYGCKRVSRKRVINKEGGYSDIMCHNLG